MRIEAARWQMGVESAVCFINACDYGDIDPRGPVFVRGDDEPHYACTEHWEAIFGVLGRQAGSDEEMRVRGWGRDGEEGGADDGR